MINILHDLLLITGTNGQYVSDVKSVLNHSMNSLNFIFTNSSHQMASCIFNVNIAIKNEKVSQLNM